MSELQEQVKTLIAEACSYPAGHLQRQRRLTQIIRLISKHLWKENTPYYQDALQQTWIYFCQNLCEGKTANTYDPNKASVITWLNTYLKYRLKDGHLEKQKQRARTVSYLPSKSDPDNQSDPVDMLPARPDVPPLLEDIKAWVESDPNGQLKSTHLTGHSHITVKFLILKRLPPETPWKKLATDLDVPVPTLSSFYRRQCMPRLRKFAKSQGYL